MKISGKGRVIGLFGYPVFHTLSPIFQNAAFSAENLNLIYLPFSVKPESLKGGIEAIRSLNFKGANVTIPHKENVIPFLDEISEEAKNIGAVNTILNKEGKLIGYNTDGSGFLMSLKEEGKFEVKNKNIFLIGAGGAARAVSFSLLQSNCQNLFLTNWIKEEGEKLVKNLNSVFKEKRVKLINFKERNSAGLFKDIDLLVNCTSVGMKKGDALIIDPCYLSKKAIVYDLVYNRKTELLLSAKKRGLRVLSGLGMLIFQGAISFEIWTGKKAPIEVMKIAIKNAIL